MAETHDGTKNRGLLRLATLAAVLIVAEVAGRRTNPIIFVPPSAMLKAFLRLLTDGELPAALWFSFRTLVLGFILGAIPGTGLGMAMGRYRIMERIFEPYVNALYATPLVALTPLVVVWFGPGLLGKVLFVALWVVFPVLVNTYVGTRDADRSLLEVGRAFGASEQQILKHIVWPYVIPYVVSGLRLAVGRAIVGMVVAEMSLRLSGLGGLLMVYGASFSTDVVFALVLILLAFGAGLTELVRMAERKVAPWKWGG